MPVAVAVALVALRRVALVVRAVVGQAERRLGLLLRITARMVSVAVAVAVATRLIIRLGMVATV